MKVALVTETYPPEINGVAMTLSQLVGGLRDSGHQVQVVRPLQGVENGNPSENERSLTVFGIPIPRYPGLRFGLPCRNRLIHAWSRRRPDVAHVATEGPLGYSAIQAAKRLGIPTTSTFHTNFHSYTEHYNAKAATRLILAFLRWIHNQTRRTMAPTRELADQLAAEGFRNMEVLGRGVRLDVFNPQARDPSLRAEWGAAPEAPVFLHVSRLAPEKNYELLATMYSKIRDVEPRARFVVVGNGPLEGALRQRMPYAHFTGAIPLENRAALARVYASADAFLFASKTESYGNVLPEAMACGNAVVAFDYAAAGLHITHQANGLVAPLNDDAAFAQQSLALAIDSQLRARLGRAANAYAPAFDWQPVFERFEALLLQAASDAP